MTLLTPLVRIATDLDHLPMPRVEGTSSSVFDTTRGSIHLVKSYMGEVTFAPVGVAGLILVGTFSVLSPQDGRPFTLRVRACYS